MIQLPPARRAGNLSVEQALSQRRSIRNYQEEPLEVAEVSQLLWAAQGVTGPRGLRSAPSAGAIYPLELYLVVGNVESLQPGLYHYDPANHGLDLVTTGDCRAALAAAALGQPWVTGAAAILLMASVPQRMARKYRERGTRYVHLEAGHIAQNVYLQAESLGLGTVAVGAFRGENVKAVLRLRDEEEPLYLMPVGRKQEL